MSIEFDIQQSTKISGVYILTPSVSEDARGNIWTSFLKGEVEELLPDDLFFKHDKFSTSKHNVLRGIHGDTKSWKLVTCVHGEIQQVVVDMRKDSSTYKKWQSFVISQDNQKLILVPPNMGNAYYVNSSEAVYHYKLAYDGDYIDADEQFSVSWNDTSIGIKWLSNKPILSNRDAK
jgi:dTDP-4-dehydrorhamnose 3,5-epimerase